MGVAGLQLEHVTVTFGGVRAVDDVSFEVVPQSIVSLIGPNGAGKTTLLNAISGFVPCTGTIFWKGQDVRRQPAYLRAAVGIGRTFQSVQLFRDMTVLENVLVGTYSTGRRNLLADLTGLSARRERAARTRALEVLRQVDIEHLAGARARDLPFGLQKLAGVARALAASPGLLLLDEPAAGLNHSEAAALGQLIGRLRSDLELTILLVEHNMRLVMDVSDEAVVLDRGALLTRGTPTAIAAHPAVIAAYLGTEAEQSALSARRTADADGP